MERGAGDGIAIDERREKNLLPRPAHVHLDDGVIPSLLHDVVEHRSHQIAVGAPRFLRVGRMR